MSYTLPTSRKEAAALDAHDILRHAREHFDLPEGRVYLVGHSLGPATHNAVDSLFQTARSDWRNSLVGAWNSAGWFHLAETLGDELARLVGAKPGEVLVTDSVSINLFKLAHAARSRAQSPVLIVEADEFPTDQYMLEGLAGLGAAELRRCEPGHGLATLGETGGILVRSAINYRTGEVADMTADEEIARASGGVIVWDLSHATGVIRLDLEAAGVQLATGCTYKYLNGGPGAPAFLYVREGLASQLQTPLPGWMGDARPFDFQPAYQPADGIRRFLCGTPPILSLSALAGALEVFEAVDLDLVEEKARALGELVLRRAGELGLESSAPREGERRGGHVSLRHAHGYEIVQALGAKGIQADFRAPDTIRFGGSPLYLRFEDIWDAMEALEDILTSRSWDRPEYRKRAQVT